ncbi:hypothetical protein ACM46_04580 [Chryseobacterium angstadtii]|uniref:Uncharacterized protein n=2 Tax=Chryseobacterium angstadtii TaxID=558151 RepID=A0A0J7ILM4_9FLAO|nr:hypothetical protein ACM46_04580 [Chryseobacterium angstadtii]
MILCVQNLWAQTESLKPEAVFGMYFDTFVKQDERALQQLNDYLTPFLGAENTYTIDLNKSFKDEVKNLTGNFLANLPKETAAGCEAETEEYFRALLSNLKNTQYAVKSMKEVKNEYADHSFVAELNVDLSFPVPAKIAEIKLEEVKKMKDLRNYLKSKTKAFRQSEKQTTVQQKFKLYQVKKDGNIYYWNGGPQELVWKLNELYFNNLSR